MKFTRSCMALGLALTRHVSASSVLFERGTVISFDEATQTPLVLRDTSLLVVDDRIAAIFSGAGNATIPTDVERINAQDMILSPGFVDTHRHGWQTAFKTIASNTTLGEYFGRYGEYAVALSGLFGAEDVYHGQLTGIWESLNAGVTSLLDHAHGTFSNETASAAVNASVDSGVRLWFAYGMHSLSNGFTIAQQAQSFKGLLADERITSPNATVTMGIAYDEWTVSSPENVTFVMDLAKSSNISVFTTHHLGGPWNYGNSPVLLDGHNFLNTTFPIVFSHSSFLTPQDSALLRKYNHYISTTPESEMHYGHDNEHNAFIQDQTALGVDTHFTFSSDIIGQARIWLQTLRIKFFRQTLDNWKIASKSPMSTNQAFLLATRAGGLALRRPDIGVLKVGAKADIAVFDGTSPNMLGWHDPVAAIILHSHVGDVKHVLVNGQWRKKDGVLLIPQNRTEVQARFLASARRIQKVFLDLKPPVLEGEYSEGIEYTVPEMVDVIRGNGTGY